MKYVEYSFTLPISEIQRDMLSGLLSEMGFDAFMDDEDAFKAYSPSDLVDREAVDELLQMEGLQGLEILSVETLPDKDWNEVWEASYQPVVVNEKCRVRAPFHQEDPSFEFDLVIEPKMSFGTANHETTFQMIMMMLDSVFAGKNVLDMGSGTAVLAILAKKLGSKITVAIDNDEWAYNNAFTNIALNGIDDISVELGDANTIGDRKFDVVLANINRNILLRDMHLYEKSLNQNGKLFMSGFYSEDLLRVKKEAERLGLTYRRHLERNNWIAIEFNK
jgi:Ribosomal protein L11 methylase